MSGLAGKLSSLSPERVELLIAIMGTKGLSVADLPIFPVQNKSTPPLSFAQERLWIIDQLEPGNSGYHMAVTLKLEGVFSPDALISAMEHVVRRHATLRTTFLSAGGIPGQLVNPPEPATIQTENLTGLAPHKRLAAALAQAAKESMKPFNLSTGPLYRLFLAKLSEEEHLLAITIHHIITDNWSMNILLEELELGYSAFLENKELKLPPLPIQYSDFSAWQRNVLCGEEIDRQLNYWKNKLANAPRSLQIPTDFPRTKTKTGTGARKTFHLDPAANDALRNLTRSKGATPFMGLLAAYALALRKLSGVDTIVIGVDVAGRNRTEVEGLFGFFVNQLALVVDLAKTFSFLDVLDQVRVSCVEAYSNQDVPFQRVVEAVGGQRDRSRTPLFQVKIVYLGFPMTKAPRFPGLRSSVILNEASSRFELELICWEDATKTEFLLEYNSGLYSAETAERLAASLIGTIEKAVMSPTQDLSIIMADNELSGEPFPKGVSDDFNF
ncbi:MAG: condensation domain-containing protein [Elusimicrobiota bacterium]|nr:condensation domain-containing protein [Elusimicrobiota bacterium]